MGGFVEYSLGEAARHVGRAKSTLSRDIKSGKLSAVRNPNGSVTIDGAELARVYRSNGSSNEFSDDRQPLVQHPLERLLAEKDARIAELQADKEDLRRRLDQATAQLTDQRASSSENEEPAARRRWRLWR